MERWYSEMPREEEMLPKDKYSVYDRKEKTYRKGIHSKFSPPKYYPGMENWVRNIMSNACVCCRIAQVDESQSTCQSSWFLMGDDIRIISNYAYQPFIILNVSQFTAAKEAPAGCRASRNLYPGFFGRYAGSRLPLHSNTLLYITWLR